MEQEASEVGIAAMKKLIFIHGWTYNLDKSQAMQAELRARDIEPVMLKVPGLTTPSDKVWDIDGYVNWLNDQIKDEKSPIIMGHSNGGRIALSYLQKYPDRFKHLILMDAAGIPHNTKGTIVKLKILKLLAKIGKLISFIPGARKVFYRLIGAADYNNAPPNMKDTMRNMLDADTHIDLSKINVPTTIIWGSEDKITPLKDGKIMHEKIKGSTLNIIDGARHAPQFSHPKEVVDVIEGVIDGSL